MRSSTQEAAAEPGSATAGGEDDPLALEAQVCLTVSAAARALVAFYRPLLEPLGLTHPQYLAMLALWQHEELSLKELASLLHLEPATASPLVRRLEALGLVVRERGVADERALTIRPTAQGRALRERAVGVPASMVAGLGLDAAQIDAVREGARLLLAACGAADGSGMRTSARGASVAVMSEDLPDSFDPQQPDLPTKAIDPDPVPDRHEGEAPTTEPDDGAS